MECKRAATEPRNCVLGSPANSTAKQPRLPVSHGFRWLAPGYSSRIKRWPLVASEQGLCQGRRTQLKRAAQHLSGSLGVVGSPSAFEHSSSASAGKLYGRGATDNKGPVLAYIHAVSTFQALQQVGGYAGGAGPGRMVTLQLMVPGIPRVLTQGDPLGTLVPLRPWLLVHTDNHVKARNTTTLRLFCCDSCGFHF